MVKASHSKLILPSKVVAKCPGWAQIKVISEPPGSLGNICRAEIAAIVGIG